MTPLIGENEHFLAVLEKVSKLATLNKPVLIIGERGTGKELIAERLHYLSQHWQGPYIKLNCGAIADSLLESELFGHESGAFTSANRRHLGRFERANGGTLFLDEIANANLNVQEKLLRVIEYGEFERLGGQQLLTSNARIIAATHQDLPNLAEQEKFRADLLDRLAFDVITLPPLRARQSDILPLAEHFAVKMTQTLQRDVFSGFSRDAQKTLLEYHWPGNVRELKSVVERSVNLCEHPEHSLKQIILDPFASEFRPQARLNEPTKPQWPLDLKACSEALEIKLIKQALIKSQYKQTDAAQLLGLSYHQLRAYLKKYSILETNRQHE
ncbi:phage shock protein operon transcriptional activator [Gayadomonas joobiniege]|uniref:phage shock protein operon transcriptional activator n=1 Tax=Gayadomonas joobiniege TaxID=1234606 RepID=UPI000382E08B|nr:phage shock protein operon transcriptional activator [Gayadomonas joobiniege]